MESNRMRAIVSMAIRENFASWHQFQMTFIQIFRLVMPIVAIM